MGKKIGIVGFYRNDMFGVHADYYNFVEQFGTPVIIPQVSRRDFFHQFKGLEGIVLPGGADINPTRYARNWMHYQYLRRWMCYPPDRTQEHFDTEILPGLIHAGFPVFGICRGLQSLNVHYGGTLRTVNWHKQSKTKTDLVDELTLTGGAKMNVNSFHHQAIGILAEGFRVIATNQDGLIEIIRHNTLPIAAVQYHPERFRDDWSNTVCRELFK